MITDPPPQEWQRAGYCLSTGRDRLDIGRIHAFLANESYWAKGLTREALERALKGSLPMAVYAPDGTLAAFARVVTDYTVFAYLRDVFVLPEHRGKRLATWLAVAIREHPALATVHGCWRRRTRMRSTSAPAIVRCRIPNIT